MVLNVWSHHIVALAMATHVRTELVLGALNMALAQRRTESVIHHSYQSCQYTRYAFRERCREVGVMPSMGSVNDAYDHAMAESFFATLERKLLKPRSFETQYEAKLAILEWIEGWHNPHRRNSALRYLSPINSERKITGTENWAAKTKNCPLTRPSPITSTP